MFPNLVPRIFPVIKSHGVCFYPVAGFRIANTDRPNRYTAASGANYAYNFGFDFGIGIDYDLPTLLPVLQDMTANFEIQYQAVEIFSRPQLLFGIMYNF
jgi:hypothetical protein